MNPIFDLKQGQPLKLVGDFPESLEGKLITFSHYIIKEEVRKEVMRDLSLGKRQEVWHRIKVCVDGVPRKKTLIVWHTDPALIQVTSDFNKD